MYRQVKKGEIYYCDLSPVVGSEQGGCRPVLILQNDMGNKFSPTTIVAIITTAKTKKNIPTHHWLSKDCGLPQESMVELEQIRTIDKRRLQNKVGETNKTELKEIEDKVLYSFGIKVI